MPSISDAKCILIVGATSGIGRELAKAIHDLPSKPTVIVSGRRQERLDELSSAYERMVGVRFDVTSGRKGIEVFVKDILAKYPQLDAFMFPAGVQHILDLKRPESVDLDFVETELFTNYTSFVTLTVLLLPHFLKLSAAGRHSFVIPVTSLLSIVPGANVPGYSGSKAAMHSFTLSLHSQLEDTNVHAMEVIPPLTESELHDHQGTTPRLATVWMPLSEFTPIAMAGLMRGDLQIQVGEPVVRLWNQYEKGKIEEIAAHKAARANLKIAN